MSHNSSSVVLANSVAYINGSIYTVDNFNPWASGFIVSPDGFFTHVGTTEEMASIANRSQLIVVDLKGNFTMPGLHDAHAHLMLSGLALTSDANIGTNVTELNFADRVQEGQCACEYINVYQNWILAEVGRRVHRCTSARRDGQVAPLQFYSSQIILGTKI